MSITAMKQARDDMITLRAMIGHPDNVEIAAKLIKRLDAAIAEAEKQEPMTEMIDAAMVEMQNIVPPLRRSECKRLIAAALSVNPTPQLAPKQEQCWCTTCRPITMSDMRFVVCPDCGNKRCPKARNHTNACTGSNESGQVGSSWAHVQAQEPVIHRPRLERVKGNDFHEWGRNISPEMKATGDVVLCWVNEGDLYCPPVQAQELITPQALIEAANSLPGLVSGTSNWASAMAAKLNAAVVKECLTTQEPTPLEAKLVDTLLGQMEAQPAPKQEPIGYVLAGCNYLGSIIARKGHWESNEVPVYLAAGAGAQPAPPQAQPYSGSSTAHVDPFVQAQPAKPLTDSISWQFKKFREWANDAGYDTAHTHDGVNWICLNPMTADLWRAWQAAHGIKEHP